MQCNRFEGSIEVTGKYLAIKVFIVFHLSIGKLRQTTDDARWPGIERYVRIAFWGTNGGLALMVGLSLFPAGLLQLWDVLNNGYWHARSLDYIGSDRSRLLEWMRMPGDVVFIVFGAVPLVIASVKGYLGMREATMASGPPQLAANLPV